MWALVLYLCWVTPSDGLEHCQMWHRLEPVPSMADCHDQAEAIIRQYPTTTAVGIYCDEM
jgi:hypothetical protein